MKVKVLCEATDWVRQATCGQCGTGLEIRASDVIPISAERMIGIPGGLLVGRPKPAFRCTCCGQANLLSCVPRGIFEAAKKRRPLETFSESCMVDALPFEVGA